MKKLAVVLSMLVGVGIFLTGCNNEENSIQAYTDELNAIYENPEVYQEIKEYFGANDLQMMSIPFLWSTLYLPCLWRRRYCITTPLFKR